MPLTMLVSPISFQSRLRPSLSAVPLAGSGADAGARRGVRRAAARPGLSKADRDEPLAFAADSARVDGRRSSTSSAATSRSPKAPWSCGPIASKSGKTQMAPNRRRPLVAQVAKPISASSAKVSMNRSKAKPSGRLRRSHRHRAFHRQIGHAPPAGAQGHRRGRWPVIVYDNKTSVFQVLGSASGSGASSGGRVRGVITRVRPSRSRPHPSPHRLRPPSLPNRLKGPAHDHGDEASPSQLATRPSACSRPKASKALWCAHRGA